MLSVSSLLILIVEDESLIGLDVQDGLELAGFQTVFVACPLEAAALLEAEKSNFAGLVTDIPPWKSDDRMGFGLGRARSKGQLPSRVHVRR